MADNLDAMFPADNAVETAEPVVDVTPEPVVEVSQEPTPEPVIETPQPEARQDSDRIPIGALLDEREKRKALEQELEGLKRQQAPQQAAIPDPYDDPTGFAAHIESQITQARQAQKVDTSYHLAVRDHGKDTVEEARQWALEKAQTDPVFMQQVEVAFQTQALPIDWVVQQHKRDGLMSQIGDRSIDDFVKDYLAKNPALLGQSAPVVPAVAPVMAVQQPASRPAMPPRSIAADSTPATQAPSADPMAGLNAIFNRG